MIAIPVKTNKDNPPVSTLFGKSKWFAFIDNDNNISIESNETDGGREVVENMITKGVTKLVFQHMGGNPFMLLQNGKIEFFYSEGERILLNDVLEKLKNNQLEKIDSNNMANYLEQNNKHNGNSKHHEHSHHKH